MLVKFLGLLPSDLSDGLCIANYHRALAQTNGLIGLKPSGLFLIFNRWLKPNGNIQFE